jgi:hypothetical protein
MFADVPIAPLPSPTAKYRVIVMASPGDSAAMWKSADWRADERDDSTRGGDAGSFEVGTAIEAVDVTV